MEQNAWCSLNASLDSDLMMRKALTQQNAQCPMLSKDTEGIMCRKVFLPTLYLAEIPCLHKYDRNLEK